MKKRVCIFFMLLSVLPAVTTGAWQITEFCPDPFLADDADEFLVLEGSGSLDGYAIAGPLGGFRFPDGTIRSGRITVSRSGKAFRMSHLTNPDWEWIDSDPSIPNVVNGDVLRLSNSKGTLTLSLDGTVVQEVSWPGDVTCREGQIHFLDEGVWDPRPLLIGQSRFSPSIYREVTLDAFLSPESSLEAYDAVVNSAKTQILVNVYEFSSISMAESLIRSKERGVDVVILLEGGPVGGISAEENYVCHMMVEAGIPVWQMTNTGVGHAPYRYNHAKYIVADGEYALVTTENFGENGFPSGGGSGNRGWGVIIYDPGTAEYFRRVFLSDLDGPGIARFQVKEGMPEKSDNAESSAEYLHPTRFQGATVTPILSPDSSSLIRDLISGAQDEILVEQAYITNSTDGNWNPYLSEVIDASRRGVKARILLDAYWFNVDGTEDNDEMAASINRLARMEGLPMEARCSLPIDGNIEKIHDKGVIVDGQYVLVSSINWNSNSPAFNREAGVIIDHEGVGDYFKEAFETDWREAGPTTGGPEGPDTMKIGAVTAVLILLGIVYMRKRYR